MNHHWATYDDTINPGNAERLGEEMKMDRQRDSYQAWIEENVDSENGGYGKCREVCAAMAQAFPKLEVRKGIFRSVAWGDRTHWWCKERLTGKVVDPTARQHPDGVWFSAGDNYDDLTDMTEEEAIAADKMPVGKCPNCGDAIWFSSGYTDVCSEECSISYAAYINEGLQAYRLSRDGERG